MPRPWPRSRSCERPGPGSSRPATRNDAASNAISTTARSSAWWGWRWGFASWPPDRRTRRRYGRPPNELQAAIDELRALARGLAPLVLTDAGVAAAVRSLGESRELRLVEAPTERFPAVVESTAYLAVDRATVGSPAEVALRHEHGLLRLTVSVRGPVPDLGDLADRVTTLGGEVRVEPVAGGFELSLALPDFRSEPEVPRRVTHPPAPRPEKLRRWTSPRWHPARALNHRSCRPRHRGPREFLPRQSAVHRRARDRCAR